MSDKVGIAIVSHSPEVARGVADMVRQAAGPGIVLAWCGGNRAGGLGTDVDEIVACIGRAWSEAGVAVFVDLGGAEMNAECAIESLPKGRRARVVLCNAPLVEGAMVAAAQASVGGTLDEVRRTAEEWNH